MASTFNADAYDPTYIPQRTSVMAIIALVLGLICFVPGLGVLAVIFGIAAIIAISRAGGRLIGTGMAVTGVVVGLLVSVLWIGAGIGAMQAYGAIGTKLIGPTNAMISSFDSSGDPSVLRKVLSPAGAATVTDAQIAAFRDAYRAEVGNFKGIPNGPLDVIKSYSRFGQQMQKYQGRPGQPPDLIPVPAEFEKGWALIVLRMDRNPNAGQAVQIPGGTVVVKGSPPAPGTNPIPLIDVSIETMTGKTIKLSEMPGGPVDVKPADSKVPDAKAPETKPAEGTPPAGPK